MAESVGVIGLGKMGLPMARHLVEHGYDVVATDTREQQCARARELGITTVDTCARVATASRVSLVVVGFDNEVLDVVLNPVSGILCGAARGHVVAICSTVLPRTSRDAGAQAATQGVHVVDATLCLGEPAAEAGTLLVMGGGDLDIFESIRPALSSFASDIHLLGPLGSGQTGKMLNNYLLWSAVVANYESFRLAARLGVDVDELRHALLLSSGNNWALETWERSRPMPWAEKDMGIVMTYADEMRLPLPLAGLTREEIKAIKIEKNPWRDGAGEKASMMEFLKYVEHIDSR